MHIKKLLITDQHYARLILQNLNPEEVVNLLLVNKLFRDAFKNPFYWQTKVQEYFPIAHQYLQSNPKTDWMHSFNALASRHYKGMSLRKRGLFLGVKAGDSAIIRALDEKLIYELDAEGNRLLQCIAERGHQPSMNHVFEQLMLPQYQYRLPASSNFLINTEIRDLIDRYTILHHAAMLNQAAFIEQVLSEVVKQGDLYGDVNDGALARVPEVTPLQLAALYGHVDAVAVLLKYGAQVDFVTVYQGFTPLDIAACAGKVNVMKLLLAAGANINGLGGHRPPLFTAAFYGQWNAFEYLWQRNASTHHELSVPLLHQAVHGGNFNIIDAVIEHKLCPIDAVNIDEVTALQFAAMHGDEHVYDRLIAAKANPYLVSKQGNLLYYAAQSKHVALVKKVFETIKTATPLKAMGEYEYTPLHGAVIDPACEEITREIIAFLLTQGAAVNAQDNQGRTPLFVALESGQPHSVIAQLLHAGANPNLATVEGVMPLHAIITKTSIDRAIIALLLEHGADANAVNAQNKTPLHLLLTVLRDPRTADDEEEDLADYRRVDLLLKYGAKSSVDCEFAGVEESFVNDTISKNTLLLILSKMKRVQCLNLINVTVFDAENHADDIPADQLSFPELQVLGIENLTVNGDAFTVFGPLLAAAPELRVFRVTKAAIDTIPNFFESLNAIYAKNKSLGVGSVIAQMLERGWGGAAKNLIAAKEMYITLGMHERVERVQLKIEAKARRQAQAHATLFNTQQHPDNARDLSPERKHKK